MYTHSRWYVVLLVVTIFLATCIVANSQETRRPEKAVKSTDSPTSHTGYVDLAAGGGGVAGMGTANWVWTVVEIAGAVPSDIHVTGVHLVGPHGEAAPNAPMNVVMKRARPGDIGTLTIEHGAHFNTIYARIDMVGAKKRVSIFLYHWDGTPPIPPTGPVTDDCGIDPGSDCDADGIPDSCESDLDLDGIPDACDTAELDCNGNGIEDALEIFWGFAQDQNSNDVPDDCEGPPPIIPSLTGWGMIFLGLLVIVSAIWLLRKKRVRYVA